MSVLVASYWDDSGTHKGSPVTLYGGLFGFEDQWLAFEKAWQEQLKEPTDGKSKIKRLHMYDLEHSIGEFEGYNQANRDSTIYNFRKIILDCKLHGYVIAIENEAYDELIRDGLRSIWGDAETHCITQCILRLGLLVGNIDPTAKITMVFDDRVSRNRSNKKVFELFQRYRDFSTPQLGFFSNIAFDCSMTTTPLQGADLIAYEYYKHVRNIVLGRGRPVRAREHWARIEETGRFYGEMALRPNLQAMADNIKVDPQQGEILRTLLDLP